MWDEEPTWRPVTDVAMVTTTAVQGVEAAREFLDTIRPARPYQLDDVTVTRMLDTWNETSEWCGVYTEQGRRWTVEAKGTRHEADVAHYCAIVAEERALVDEVLAIAHELKEKTTEALLAKSDFEVGLDALADPGLRASRPGPTSNWPRTH